MLFNSWVFIFCFLPLFLFCWQIAHSDKYSPSTSRCFVLLLFSLVFYALWGLPFLILLLVMIIANYCWGLGIARSKMFEPENNGNIFFAPKTILICALIFNVLPLIWFKYSWFIIRNIGLLFHANWEFTPPDLPLGISFYTFIQIAWLVSIYRAQITPEGIWRHALFTSCFAWVISGPIVRYEQIGWQLDKLEPVHAENLAPGLALFSIGLAKKVILADSIGFYADAVFNAAEKAWPMTGLEAWLGSFCYTFQLYFDFSGYTDMALGLGLMIGLRLPENFNSPYKSTGIVDFWRRWHITLSSWLRDFLYIPLGGNRKGKPRQYANLLLTMLIGGIWHGAGWTFMIWGALHGFMLGINHFFRSFIKNKKIEKYLALLPCRLLFIFFTFLCLNFCWVVFRALSLDGALTIYSAMFCGPYIDHSAHISDQILTQLLPNNYFTSWQAWALLVASFIICWFMPNSRQIIHGHEENGWLVWAPKTCWAASLAILTFVSLLFLSRNSTFLYFQF